MRLDWREVADVRHALRLAADLVHTDEQDRLGALEARFSELQRGLPGPWPLTPRRGAIMDPVEAPLTADVAPR